MDNKIKIVFLSNFLNHHQLPICNELLKQVDGSFRFVATTPVPEERLRMGYSDYNDSHSFVVKAYDGENDEISRLISDADIVISAGAPSLSSLVKRIRSDKLTFVYAERLLKDGDQLLKNPLRLLKYKWLFHDSASIIFIYYAQVAMQPLISISSVLSQIRNINGATSPNFLQSTTKHLNVPLDRLILMI